MDKIYVKTFGCSTNFSEGEVIAGLLRNAQFEIDKKPDDALVIILNACTVKGEGKVLRKLRQLHDAFPHKRYVLAGCLTDRLIDEAKKIVEGISLISTHNLKEIVSVVEETLNDNPVMCVEQNDAVKIGLPRLRRNRVIAIIPISSGCVGECSYCSVRLIKGRLRSYPTEMIVDEVQKAVKDGCKEIWLTAQDTAAYGIDMAGKSLLPELLRKVLAVPGMFYVRLGMGNPEHVTSIAEELAELFMREKMFRFLHLPVQSGNDDVLKLMKRRYTVSEFMQLVQHFRDKVAQLTVSTDIIVGFPGETEQQFRDSMNIIDKLRPDVLNLSKFRPRPGTAACSMERVDSLSVKKRSGMLASGFDWVAYEVNRKWKGWQGKVLIDEKGKDDTWIGRNQSYKPVVVESRTKLGDTICVKILDTTKHDLRGVLVDG